MSGVDLALVIAGQTFVGISLASIYWIRRFQRVLTYMRDVLENEQRMDFRPSEIIDAFDGKARP